MNRRNLIIIPSAIISILFPIYLIIYSLKYRIGMEFAISAVITLIVILISSVVLFNIKLPKALKIALLIISILIVLLSTGLLGVVLYRFISNETISKTTFFITFYVALVSITITMLTYAIQALKISDKILLIAVGLLCAVISAVGIIWYNNHANPVMVARWKLYDKDPKIQCEAIETLYILGAKEAIPDIIRQLDDEDFDVIVAAAHTLGKMGDKKSVPELTKALDRTYEWRGQIDRLVMRTAIMEALLQLDVPEKHERGSIPSGAGEIRRSSKDETPAPHPESAEKTKEPEPAKTQYPSSGKLKIEISQQDIEAWRIKGDILYQSTKYREALDSFKEITKIDESDYGAWFSMGNALQQLGQYDESIDAYNKSLNFDDSQFYLINNIALYNIASCFSLKGDRTNALKYLRRAVKSDRYMGERAIEDLSFKIFQSNQEFKDITGKDFSPRNPGSVEMGEILIKEGKYEEAIKYFDHAIEDYAKNIRAWQGKGQALEKLGEPDEAKKAYDEVGRLRWKEGDRCYRLAVVDSYRKDKSGSLNKLLEAITWDESFKANVMKDDAFKWLWEDEEFKKLVK